MNRTIPTINLTEDQDDTVQEILRHIPIGSSIEDAERLMVREGFECSLERDSDGTFLYCDIHKKNDALVSRRWQIIIRYQDKTVASVSVSTGLMGL